MPTPEKTEAPEQTAAPTEQPAPAPANPLDTGAPRGTGAPAPASTAALAAFSATSARSVEAGDAAAPEGTAQPDAALPLSGVLVGIDPGHQARANREQELVSPGGKATKDKVSSGTAGVKTRVAEYKVNLDVSLALRDALQAQGATVYMTRETHDVDISNIERAQMMNEHGVDIVLRIHCNGSENRSAQGIGLYIRKTGEGADECYRAAEALLPAMVEATGAKATGIHKSDSYSGLNWSTVPSILVEMGYMSNAEEDVKLNDPDYQGKLVAGMVEGVARYMGKSDESAES
ncbi:MAG: N-acetylmuramoyl-L-alanine amidase [Clostridiales bacterium]|nr:N-acetylmuramoyl-L-alanine amidase [Clostridiales bacterium]